MSAADLQRIGLVVRAAPYARRASRDDLDVALAAATLEMPLEIYFLGPGVWQLIDDSEPQAAMFPRGLRAWAALAGLTDVRFFVEPSVSEYLAGLGATLMVDFEPLDGRGMARRWRACTQVWAL